MDVKPPRPAEAKDTVRWNRTVVTSAVYPGDDEADLPAFLVDTFCGCGGACARPPRS